MLTATCEQELSQIKISLLLQRAVAASPPGSAIQSYVCCRYQLVCGLICLQHPTIVARIVGYHGLLAN